MNYYVYIVINTSEVIAYYYTYLMNHMDADSVNHMMHYKDLITDDDYEAITTAPNDSKMNTVILQYVRAMDLSALFKFTDLLKGIEMHQSMGTIKPGIRYVLICTYVFLNRPARA